MTWEPPRKIGEVDFNDPDVIQKKKLFLLKMGFQVLGTRDWAQNEEAYDQTYKVAREILNLVEIFDKQPED